MKITNIPLCSSSKAPAPPGDLPWRQRLAGSCDGTRFCPRKVPTSSALIWSPNVRNDEVIPRRWPVGAPGTNDGERVAPPGFQEVHRKKSRCSPSSLARRFCGNSIASKSCPIYDLGMLRHGLPGTSNPSKAEDPL